LTPTNIDQAVSHIDLVPTLLDLLDKPIPNHLQGKSLVPFVKGETEEIGPVFMEWNPFVNWRSDLLKCPTISDHDNCSIALQANIRTIVTPDGWKLNWNNGDRSQLFNLNEDPKERINLYEVEEHQGLIAELKGMIRDWQKRTNDEVKF